MEFRLAVMEDLQQLKCVYRDIVKHMDANQIEIWDDTYPAELFEEDIKNNRLYVLYDKNELVSAFALNKTNVGDKSVEWKNNAGKFFYIDRFAVNVNCLRKGMGSLMLTKAKETAKALGGNYLRLFVVVFNSPAIALYEKNGFERACGIYDLVIDEELTLQEYGYEAVLL